MAFMYSSGGLRCNYETCGKVTCIKCWNMKKGDTFNFLKRVCRDVNWKKLFIQSKAIPVMLKKAGLIEKQRGQEIYRPTNRGIEFYNFLQKESETSEDVFELYYKNYIPQPFTQMSGALVSSRYRDNVGKKILIVADLITSKGNLTDKGRQWVENNAEIHLNAYLNDCKGCNTNCCKTYARSTMLPLCLYFLPYSKAKDSLVPQIIAKIQNENDKNICEQAVHFLLFNVELKQDQIIKISEKCCKCHNTDRSSWLTCRSLLDIISFLPKEKLTVFLVSECSRVRRQAKQRWEELNKDKNGKN